MGLSLFTLFHKLARAEMLWRWVKKMCSSISLLGEKKIFGTMVINYIFKKAGKKGRILMQC